MKNTVKKLLAAFIAILLVIPMGIMVTYAADEAGATDATQQTPLKHNANWGDADGDGVYEIATAEDFLALAALRPKNNNYQDKIVKLTADIDLNPGWLASSGTAPVTTWQSMFHFNGTLDGQGHTVRGIYCSASDNASFITNVTGGTVKNLRVENSVFTGTGKNAGFIACTRGEATFENLYIDVIVEAKGGGAGGIVSWHFSSDSKIVPKSTFTNCVFLGSVTSTNYAGGILGTNDKYVTTITDCANYGAISSTNNDLTAGLVGRIAGNANVIRSYNYGVASSGVALVNVVQTYEITATLTDVYCYVGTCTKPYMGYYDETPLGTIVVEYAGAAATAAKYASVSELVKIDAFKKTETYGGWGLDATGTKALPAGVLPMVATHNYKTTVTPPTCSQKGYTTYTCETCGHSYDGDYVETIAHTEGDTWIVDKEPTEKYAGSQHKECTVCGKSIKTEILPKLTAGDAGDEKTDKEETTTAAATTADAAATTAKKEEGGCGSNLLGGAIVLMVLATLGSAVLLKRRNEV